jgi:hypothetical protein
VVVDVRGPVVVLALVLLAALLVAVDEGGVIVLVQVIVAAMLKLAERATGVVMRDVVVVVRVHDRGVRMLVRGVPDDALCGGSLSHGAPP